MWKAMVGVFNWMPIAALIETKIFCMHGGIPNIDEMGSPFNFDMLRNMQRPIPHTNKVNRHEGEAQSPGENAMILDLLWADPGHDVNAHGQLLEAGETPLERFAPSARGVSSYFGAKVLGEFLREHNLDLIVRAHEVAEDGYRFFGAPHAPMGCLTIFSAPNYTGEYHNAAGILNLDVNMQASITVLSPPSRMRPLQEQYSDRMR